MLLLPAILARSSRLALLEQGGDISTKVTSIPLTHINRLRIKIEKDAAEPRSFAPCGEKGYKFAEPHHDAPL